MPQLATAVIAPFVTASAITPEALAVYSMAGTGYMAYGQYQTAKIESQATKLNVGIARQEAEAIKRAGEYETAQEKIEGRKTKSRILVALAKTGSVLTAGTPLSLLTETEYNIQKELRVISSQYGIASGKQLSEAALQKLYGRARTRASRYQIGSTLLTGGYQAASLLR